MKKTSNLFEKSVFFLRDIGDLQRKIGLLNFLVFQVGESIIWICEKKNLISKCEELKD